MKKMIDIRNSIIVILCITIICMCVGFAVLSVELKKEKDSTPVASIQFTDVKLSSSIKGSDKEPSGKIDIVKDGLSLDMLFTMNAINDELTYIANIANRGNVPIEIVDLLESPNYKDHSFKDLIAPVTISLSDIKGNIVPAGEEISLKIRVHYAPGKITSVKKTIPYKIGLLTRSR